MTRSRGDLRMRDPEIFLPLSLLACAHCHARILRTMAVDYENLFVEESRLSPRAVRLRNWRRAPWILDAVGFVSFIFFARCLSPSLHTLGVIMKDDRLGAACHV